MAFFEPDRYFSRISAIDIEFDIVRKGYTTVLLDIDNTILTRDKHEIPSDVALWLQKAQSAGLQFCLVSNNWHESVYDVAKDLGFPIVAKAIKPLPFALFKGLSKLGAKRSEAVMIGDQLMTDVLAAHFLGMQAYMVCPLVEHDLKHTLLLRNIEAFFLRDAQPEVPAVRSQSCEPAIKNEKVSSVASSGVSQGEAMSKG